jgi:hypothetical protein
MQSKLSATQTGAITLVLMTCAAYMGFYLGSGPSGVGKKSASEEADSVPREANIVFAAVGQEVKSFQHPSPLPNTWVAPATVGYGLDRAIENSLRANLGRLDLVIKTLEAKRATSALSGNGTVDTLRLEIAPSNGMEIQVFDAAVEREITAIDNELRPRLIAKALELRKHHFSEQAKTEVLFLRQLSDTKPGEPKLIYWSFLTKEPSMFTMSPDGTINVPSGVTVPEPTRWLDAQTYKGPERYRNLVRFSFGSN